MPAAKLTITLMRVYDARRDPSAIKGTAFLVDRLWPRGVKKEALAGVKWLKDVAPSSALRKWAHEECEDFDEFAARYTAELEANVDALKPLRDAARTAAGVTLLFAARDETRNHALVLADFLRALE